MKQYTEIIKATEVAGCPVSIHLSPEAPDWLIERVTAFRDELAHAQGPVNSVPEPDAFEMATLGLAGVMKMYADATIKGGIAATTLDALRALADWVRRLEEGR
jgi:hypothetical protein